MAKIVISGYYGFDNAGDEALLSAITSTLLQLDPDLKITVLSGNPERTKQLHGVNAISRTNVVQILRALRAADLLISGGGGLLQDTTGPFSVPYYLGVVALAKLVGTPVMFYAHGVGPIKRWTSKVLIRLIANRVELITLRDDQSRAELLRLKVTRPEMYVTADPVLGFLPGKMNWYGRRLLAQFGLEKNSRPVAGIALRDWPGMERLKPAVAGFADDLVRQGWDIVYIPMHFPEDLKTCLDTMAMMENPATVIDRALTTQQALMLMGEFDLVAGMRLHALIFAAVMDVPFIGISYDPKVRQFLQLMGFTPAGEVGQVTAAELKANLIAMAARRQEYADALREKMPGLRELARSNAVMAIRLISQPGSPAAVSAQGAAKDVSPGPDTTPVTAPAAAVSPAAVSAAGEPATVGPADAASADSERVEILGVRVDRISMAETVRRVATYIASASPHQIITLNAEIMERAWREPAFRDLINAADLVTPDGAGVVWASRYLGRPVPERVTGIDLMQALVKEAFHNDWRLFLLGAAPGIAQEAAVRLAGQYPGLDIVGFHHGYFSEAETPLVVDTIRRSGADILFVALGAPKQEYWIRDNLEALAVPVAIGVGGSFDVIAGKTRRPPVWMQKYQLEWLGRLLQEPSRFKRMLALPRFVWRVIRSRGRERNDN